MFNGPTLRGVDPTVPKAAFDREPSDWHELQVLVGQFFSEIGCHVEIDKRIELVRGQKDIDVYIEDSLVEPHALYLCECKHWKRAVTQEVVHSFRTVMSDAGATLGYVVALNGFQSGAHIASRQTNIRLVTFTELQTVFFTRWYSAMVLSSRRIFDLLFPYWDQTGGRMPRRVWSSDDRQQFRTLMQKYAFVLNHDGCLLGLHAPQFATKKRDPFSDDPASSILITSYRSYFDIIDRGSKAALREFRMLYGEEPIQGENLE
jgi:hypothetical protein